MSRTANPGQSAAPRMLPSDLFASAAVLVINDRGSSTRYDERGVSASRDTVRLSSRPTGARRQRSVLPLTQTRLRTRVLGPLPASLRCRGARARTAPRRDPRTNQVSLVARMSAAKCGQCAPQIPDVASLIRATRDDPILYRAITPRRQNCKQIRCQ